jgi:hypothetical protein
MSEGVQLVLWIAGVHFIGFLAVAVLMLPALREDPDGGPFRADEGDEGWGRPPRTPPTRPSPPRGGIPLPDAAPAGMRLRGPGRLGDARPARERRPSREPVRQPVPTPHGER